MNWDDPAATYDSGLRYDQDAATPTPHTRMKKVKLALAKKTPSKTAEFADGLVAALTGNTNVPTPDPALAVLSDGAQAIRDKITEISTAETTLGHLQDELVDLSDTLKLDIRKLADHVEDKCDGDPMKLGTTGFEMIGPRQPVGQLPTVQHLEVEPTGVQGELRARWKKVAGARNYVLDQATSAEGPWTTNVAISTRTSHTFTDLSPGTKYWFRVRAFGAAGFGGLSDVASRIAA